MEEAKMKIHGISRGDFLANKKKKKKAMVCKGWPKSGERVQGEIVEVGQTSGDVFSREDVPLFSAKSWMGTRHLLGTLCNSPSSHPFFPFSFFS